MALNKETTVKMSKWLADEIQIFLNQAKKNKSEFPSKKNFVDIAVIKFLEDKGVKLNKR